MQMQVTKHIFHKFLIVLFAVPGPHRDSRPRVGCTPFGIWNKYIKLEIDRKKSEGGISPFHVIFFIHHVCTICFLSW